MLTAVPETAIAQTGVQHVQLGLSRDQPCHKSDEMEKEEWGMGNGEWGMGNGKLKMGN